MASNFPTSLDSASEQPSPVSGTGLDDAGFEHDVVHANHSTALIAVETKLGIGSADATGASSGDVLTADGSGGSSWAATGDIEGVTAGTNLTGGGTSGTVTLNLDTTLTGDLELTGDTTGSFVGPVKIAIKNTSAGSIAKGSPVYATGSVGASGAVEVSPSLAGTASTMPALGLTETTLAVNDTGFAVVAGVIGSVDTSSYTINDSLYIASGGGLSVTRPTASTDLVQKIGRVVRVHASTGQILVLGAGRTNDVPNAITVTNGIVGGSLSVGTEFTLPTVDGSASQVMETDGAGNLSWVAQSVGDITGVTAGTNLNGGGSSGAVTLNLDTNITGDVTFDTSTLVVDATNNRVGIGTTTPATALEVSGAAAHIRITDSDTSGTTGIDFYDSAGTADVELEVGNSTQYFAVKTAGSEAMRVTSAGLVGIGTSSPTDVKLTLAGPHSQMKMVDTDDSTYIHFSYSGGKIIHRYNDTSANAFFTLDGANQRVGIGATSPSSTLHVAGALTVASGSYLAGYLYGASTSAGAGFSVVGSGGASIGFMGSPNNDDMHYQSTHTSGYYYLAVGGNYRCYSTNVGGWYPYADNTYDLGFSSKRWDDVYATNGTIQTSDVNFKKDIADTTLGLDFINALRPVEYKWLEGSRKHQGFIAQEVETVLDDQDIAADQAMWGINVFKDGETYIEPIEDENGIPQKVEVPTIPKQSLRYNEFIGPLVKAVQELSARIETLETA